MGALGPVSANCVALVVVKDSSCCMPKRLARPEITLGEISSLISARLLGNPDCKVTELAPLDEAGNSSISFFKGKSGRQLLERISNKGVSAVIVNEQTASTIPHCETALLIVQDPTLALLKIIPLFFEPTTVAAGVSPYADISPAANIGENVSIGAFVSVAAFATVEKNVVLHPHVVIYSGARIGERSVLHSHVSVREDCVVGADSVVQNGAVIGADGFGYVPEPGKGLQAVPQVGNVVLADRVDVGANTCIDRGTLGSTKIGTGTKIDNLVQVGHNTIIGQHSIVCGQSGISGSCEIGNQVVLGGSVGVADHVKIPDGSRFAARSGVVSSFEEKGDYAGWPAVPLSQWQRMMAVLRKMGTKE